MMEILLLLSVENITQRLRRIGRDCIMDYNFCVEQELKAIRGICKSDVDRVAEEILCDNTMGLAIIGQCDTDKLLDIIVIYNFLFQVIKICLGELYGKR